ncbi:uncharacterized protein LOC129919684 [Episyrphus balteatus]|uniref:uncharacterized protein LOC129919684 n=1 Tax=Episyrphus balteatus TaxID=286459 RepID=UPI00248566B1|nr:uncharacterized protein LOC129919684 [Episyrphus balteatus]
MSRILVSVLRTAIGRQLRYECPNTVPSFYHLRPLRVSVEFCTKIGDGAPAKAPKKKTKEIPKITLLQQNDAMSVTTLEEANKLARRRDLQLVKVQDLDPKSNRPVYRLATKAELLADEDLDESKSDKTTSSSSQKKPTVKSLTVGSRISDNDLTSRTKNISKWLSKGCEVRVLIQGNDAKSTELVFQKIETSIKEPQVIGKITQKRSKDGFIKFNIYPVPVEKKDSNDNQKA